MYPVEWDLNLRTVLRLWPQPTDNVRDMILHDGDVFDPDTIIKTFGSGKSQSETGKDPRAVRASTEILEQAGLAYRSGKPARFHLTPLGRCVLSFLGLTGGRCLANENNIHLPGALMIRALCSAVEQRAILALMRHTDNWLTNDELNQGVSNIRALSDVPTAAAAILRERQGKQPPASAERNQMTAQFRLASGGGLIMNVSNDRKRRLYEWAVPLIDECLGDDSPLVHASTSTENRNAIFAMSKAAFPPPDTSTLTYGPYTEERIRKVTTALDRHGKNSIIALSGVPGTGKTFVSLAAAQRFTKSPLLVETVQFHQSYGYEDFIEGLRPKPDGGFEPREGNFAQWNRQALNDPDNNYVLVIEEFTRANISAVLGELMTYIEYRDRPFVTPMGERMRVAPNLAILVTMNPQDRSALEIDDALIRRMRIIDCPPDTDQLREMLDASLEFANTRRKNRIIGGLVGLFEACQLKPNYVNSMPFGHAIFAGIKDEDDLQDLYEQRIRYLLRRPLIQPHEFADDIEAALSNTIASVRAIEKVKAPLMNTEAQVAPEITGVTPVSESAVEPVSDRQNAISLSAMGNSGLRAPTLFDSSVASFEEDSPPDEEHGTRGAAVLDKDMYQPELAAEENANA